MVESGSPGWAASARRLRMRVRARHATGRHRAGNAGTRPPPGHLESSLVGVVQPPGRCRHPNRSGCPIPGVAGRPTPSGKHAVCWPTRLAGCVDAAAVVVAVVGPGGVATSAAAGAITAASAATVDVQLVIDDITHGPLVVFVAGFPLMMIKSRLPIRSPSSCPIALRLRGHELSHIRDLTVIAMSRARLG